MERGKKWEVDLSLTAETRGDGFGDDEGWLYAKTFASQVCGLKLIHLLSDRQSQPVVGVSDFYTTQQRRSGCPRRSKGSRWCGDDCGSVSSCINRY